MKVSRQNYPWLETFVLPYFAYLVLTVVLLLDMFKSLVSANLPDDHVFTISIGPSTRKTVARYHLLEPNALIATIASLNGDISGSQEQSGIISAFEADTMK